MKHVIKLATCKNVLFLLLITYAIISIVHVRVAFYIPGLCYDLKQETIRGELNDNKTNAINP